MSKNAVKKVTNAVEMIALVESISKKAKYPAIVNAMKAASINPAILELKNIVKGTIPILKMSKKDRSLCRDRS